MLWAREARSTMGYLYLPYLHISLLHTKYSVLCIQATYGILTNLITVTHHGNHMLLPWQLHSYLCLFFWIDLVFIWSRKARGLFEYSVLILEYIFGFCWIYIKLHFNFVTKYYSASMSLKIYDLIKVQCERNVISYNLKF